MDINKLDLNTLVMMCSEKNFNSLEMNNFHEILKTAVDEFLKNRSISQIMQAFYRLDLPEFATECALAHKDHAVKVDKITAIIIQRIVQKIATRSQGDTSR